MDHVKQRATDMAFCRRVTIPNPGKPSEEAVYANMKSEMRSATMAFMSQKCDEKGRLLERNIDRETRDGLRSLSERQETGGARVQVTDKSGRHLVDTTANYVASIQPHV